MRLIFLLPILLCMQPAAAQVFIKNITLVDVEKKKLLTGYNVLAVDGRILSVEKGKLPSLPNGITELMVPEKFWYPDLLMRMYIFSERRYLYPARRN